jgi:hypothetical protein
MIDDLVIQLVIRYPARYPLTLTASDVKQVLIQPAIQLLILDGSAGLSYM